MIRLNHLVISCSLSPASRSAHLAEYLGEALAALGADVEVVDLRQIELPFCDGGASFGHDKVQALARKIANADSITLAVPVYNYDVGAVARNLIALAGKAWTEKVVGFVGAAGGERAYTSVMGLATSLMLDFRTVIVPRYVYASPSAFSSDGQPDEEITGRLDTLAADLHRFAGALGVRQ